MDMNLQQLRIVRETIRQDFNLTEVAGALFTSQPGVSKHIKDLEDELGVEIFTRRGKRLLGLTEPGRELSGVVERILLDTQNLRRIADQFSNRESGNFVLATTHTQARYALPQVIKWFKETYPKVHLVLHQGGPKEIADMLAVGDADVGIATEGLVGAEKLATFPCYSWRHAIIVPTGHPLIKIHAEGKLTLEAIAEYPIITYHSGVTGRSHIDEAFNQAGIVPDIVLSAIDADVIKTYVSLGLGVGLIAAMAFDPAQDRDLLLLESELFPTNTTVIAVRKGAWLRDYAYTFIEKLAPGVTAPIVRAAIRPEQS
ncbi:CysB family transcriptional regulator [Betaproteobacteria bacterium]|nr:CysB family transcriptional regulator [Betaproteobacteria bacterium]GHU40252.1 CysB family transcriptional regulator [Betaproteobacteria bacterium]